MTLNRVNSLEQPTLISPVEKELTIKGKALNQVLPPSSFSIVRIKVVPVRLFQKDILIPTASGEGMILGF